MANKFFCHYKFPIGFLVLVCVLFYYRYFEVNSQDKFPIYVNNTEDYMDTDMNIFENKLERIDEIKERIKRHNKVSKTLISSMPREYFAVIVVKVRSNTFYFKNLLKSLGEVVGIRKTFLIFSHETYDDHINEVVKNITFAGYIQIFYPYSIQLHPKKFPGDDLSLCLNDLKCEKNDGRRNATLVQTKLHWWWTLSFVFEHLKFIEQYNSTIVFLDEHEYVAKDFIYILNMLEYARPNVCPRCLIFGLAILKPNITRYYQNPSDISIRTIGSTEELKGIAFNRTVWYEIKKLNHLFCSFNDVDWMRSLVYSLTESPSRTHFMLSIDEPRVFRFDICPSYNCGDFQKLEMKQALISKIKRGLFPRQIVVRPYNEHVILNISKGHGGWGDVRDRRLCKCFTRRGRRERYQK